MYHVAFPLLGWGLPWVHDLREALSDADRYEKEANTPAVVYRVTAGESAAVLIPRP